MKEKAQTIGAGFVILSVANILVKVMSLVFVPLIRGLLGGDAGYSVYNSAYSVYAFVYVIATAGFPVAVSKLVSEFTGVQRTGEAMRSFRLARNLLVVLGAILTVLVMIFARPIAAWMNNPDSWGGILCLAPTLFICSLLSAYRGYFQGRKNMRPTAVSQIAEQFVHVAVSVVLVFALRSKGIVWAVAGASVGTAVGAAAALLIVVYKFRAEKSLIRQTILAEQEMQQKNPARPLDTASLLKRIFYYSLPITLSSGVQYGGDLLDSKMIRGGLMAAGFSEHGAQSLHGAYMAMRQLINVPSALATALCISVLPVIAGAYARKDRKSVSQNAAYGFKLCYMAAVPISFAMVLFGRPIYRLLGYGENYFLLMLSALSVLLLCTMHLQSSILQGVNRMLTSSVFLCISVAVKAVLNAVLIRIPSVHIFGAVLSTYVAYAIPVFLNGRAIRKAGIRIPVLRCLMPPVAASTVTVLSSYILYSLLNAVFGRLITGYFGTLITFLPAVVFAVLVYYFSMRKMGALRDSDIAQISPALLRLLKKLRLA